jgi:hypothetical protein
VHFLAYPGYLLFIVKTSLRSFAFSLVAQRILSSLNCFYNDIAKQFKYYADCSVTLCPEQGKDISIMRVAQHTTALEHYSGGCPVPRAQSLYNGSQQIYAIIPADVRFFSSLFTFRFLFKQLNRRL